MINEINMLGALVRGEIEECNMKDPLEKAQDAKEMEAEIEQAIKGVLIYRDCEIKRIYPPIPGVWYEWARVDYVDLDSPWFGTCQYLEHCKDEIDNVYYEIEMDEQADDFEDEMKAGKFDINRTIKEHG